MVTLMALWLLLAASQEETAPDAVQQAIQQYRAGAQEEARAAFQALLVDSPDDHDVLLEGARFLCVEVREFAAGEPLAQRVVELRPQDTTSYYPMFSCLLGTGRGKAYADLTQKVIGQDPENALLHFHLGAALRMLERRTEALAAFEKSIALDPTRAAAYYQAGGIALAIRRYERAEQLFREALRVNPEEVDALWQLARVLKYQGRDQDAEKYFLLAVKTGRPNADYEYGVFLFESDRHEECVERLHIYVQKAPRKRMGWHYLARAHRELGNRGKAQNAMERFRALQKERDRIDDQVLRDALFGRMAKQDDGDGD